MNNYIVYNKDELMYNQCFLVKSYSKRQALNKVYEVYGEEYRKKDYKVYSLNQMYNDSDIEDVAVIV